MCPGFKFGYTLEVIRAYQYLGCMFSRSVLSHLKEYPSLLLRVVVGLSIGV